MEKLLYLYMRRDSGSQYTILTINILLFLKCGILGFYAGKSHNLIGQGIFHGDQDFFISNEKSRDLSNYEISSITS